MTWIIGLDPRRVDDAPLFGLGEYGSESGSIYLYVKTNVVVSQAGEVLVVADDFFAHPVTTSTDLVGRQMGVALVPAAAGKFLWIQVLGSPQILVAAGCDSHAHLRATATAGVLDDSGSGPIVAGIVSSQDNGAMQGLVNATVVYPVLQVAGGGGGSGSDTVTGTATAGTPLEVDPLTGTVAASGAHGLSSEPDFVDQYLECLTADRDWVVGDRAYVVEASRGTLGWDDTNLYFSMQSSSSRLSVTNKDGTASGNITGSRWKLVATPYIYEDQVISVAAVDAASIIAAVNGTPTDNQVVTYNTAGTDLDWSTPSGGGGGLTEAEVDARIATYGRITPTGRMAAAQLPTTVALSNVSAIRTASLRINVDAEAFILDARGYSGTAPAFTMRHGTGGDQRAIQCFKGSDSTRWLVFAFRAGTDNKPGIAIGGGSSSPDTHLYREAANELKTPDAFSAATLELGTGTLISQTAAQRLATTQTNLGITPIPALTSGDANKHVTVNSGGSALELTDPPSGSVTLSDADPIVEGTAAAGTSSDVSRADHVHPSGGGGGGTLTVTKKDIHHWEDAASGNITVATTWAMISPSFEPEAGATYEYSGYFSSGSYNGIHFFAIVSADRLRTTSVTVGSAAGVGTYSITARLHVIGTRGGGSLQGIATDASNNLAVAASGNATGTFNYQIRKWVTESVVTEVTLA